MKSRLFYFYVLVFASLISLELQADESRLKLVDAQFGRLFISPASRELLDKYKHSGLPPESEQVANVEKSQGGQTIRRTRAVVVSGVMVTESGKQRVWLQDDKHPEASQDSPVAKAGKTSDDSTKVLVHAQHKSRMLKPGQVWLLEEQRVRESYELKRQQVSVNNSSTSSEEDAKNPAEEPPVEGSPSEKKVEQEKKHESPDS